MTPFQEFLSAREIWEVPLTASIVAGVLLGALGVFVVLRRTVFVSAALTQLSTVGLVLGLLVEERLRIEAQHATAQLVVAIAFSVVGALVLGAFHSRHLPAEAAVGGVWLMWLLGYNMSVAVAVGFIALAGVAAETGVVMLIYLDHAWEEIKAQRAAEGGSPTLADLYAAIMQGAVERVRPKMMTVVAIMAGLLPIMWGSGTGSEVMRRIAAPMVGGMVSSTILTLIVIPAIYALVKEFGVRKTRVG